MEEIKGLVRRYYDLQRASEELPQLRGALVTRLKAANMTKAKFNFGDRVIQYSAYQDQGSITQKLLREYLARHYPQIDAEHFITGLYGSRKAKTVETIRVTRSGMKSGMQEQI